MKKTILIAIALIFALNISWAQVNMVWNAPVDFNFPGNDIYTGTIDSSGNFYYVYSTNFWSQDTIRLRKYNNQGVIEWDNVLRTLTPNDMIWKVDCIIDDQENIVMAMGVDHYPVSQVGYMYRITNSGTISWQDSILSFNYTYFSVTKGDAGSFYIQYSDTVTYTPRIRHISGTGATIYQSHVPHVLNTTNSPPVTDNLNNLWMQHFTVGVEDSIMWYKLDPAGNLTDSVFVGQAWSGPPPVFDNQNNMIICYNQAYPPNSGTIDSLKAGFRKYDAAMNLLWDTGPTEIYRIIEMYVDNSGNIYAYGDISAFCPAGEESKLAKLDPAGNIQWITKFGLSLSGDTPFYWGKIHPLPSGNPAVIGMSYPPGYGTTFETDMFFIRTLDSSGVITADKTFIAQAPLYNFHNSIVSKIYGDNLYYMSNESIYKFCVSCTPTISGTIYYDSDSSCSINGLESGISGNVLIQPGTTILQTDSSGYFEMSLPDNNYQVIFPAWYNYTGTCNSDTIPVSIVNGVPVNQVNNGKYMNPALHDMVLEYGRGAVRPGFNASYSLRYTNIGGSVQSGNVVFVCDSNFTFIQSVPPPLSVNGDTIQWSFSNLQMANYEDINLTLKVDSIVPIMSYMVSHISVSGNLPDLNPTDNLITDSAFVTGSFDPNDKSVLPSGISPQGFITASDSALHYTIRFENTGNDTAFMVTILDVLDPDLDIATLSMGVSSHNYMWDIVNGNTLRIRFINIYLPDTSNPNENKGYVCYSIKQKTGLLPGTVISNTAQIYFDFNSPIFTNTTINTIFNPLGISEKEGATMHLFPNPANDKITIRFMQPGITNLVFYNIYGQAVKLLNRPPSNNLNSTDTFDISDLSPGVYLIRDRSNNSSGIRFLKL